MGKKRHSYSEAMEGYNKGLNAPDSSSALAIGSVENRRIDKEYNTDLKKHPYMKWHYTCQLKDECKYDSCAGIFAPPPLLSREPYKAPTKCKKFRPK